MLVSCLLPTYNKFRNKVFGDCTHLVEEALESYRRQDYPHKELILCNDCPGQEYSYPFAAQDRVTIINLPKRFRSLGEKLNFMAAVASGDLLFRWDDDDIFLPWRLSTQVEQLKNGYGYVTAGAAWWWESGKYTFKIGSGFSQIAVSRKLMVATRGYAFMGVGEDQEFEQRVRSMDNATFKSIDVTPSTAFAVYRWGTGSEHVSGYGSHGYEAMGRTQALPGSKVLNPCWREDYLSKIKALCHA